MKRGLIAGLTNPHPLGAALPGLYHDDDFTQRLTGAFDEMLAPVIATLDNVDAYLDPALAPDDFVNWLASWVGLVLDEGWPAERRRALVARAVELYGWHGTVRGLTELVTLYTGVRPEITDSGGASWFPTPGGHPPGSDRPELVVRVPADPEHPVDRNRLEALILAAKPAHIPHRIEVVDSSTTPAG